MLIGNYFEPLKFKNIFFLSFKAAPICILRFLIETMFFFRLALKEVLKVIGIPKISKSSILLWDSN